MQILNTLNEDQKKAVAQTDGPILVTAGPGSGKTKVLTHKIAYLIEEKNIDPLKILAVTFTNKAAGEMKERISDLVSSGHPPSWMGTFHGIAARVLREVGVYEGINPKFLIYDTSDSKSLIRQIINELGFDPKKINPGAVYGTISSAKNELINPQEYNKYAFGFFKQHVAKIYPRYQSKLNEIGALDFDDLIMKLVETFRNNPEVCDRYQDKFDYVFVDEYQDTNHAQYVLIKLLTKNKMNICVVGDMSQAIYSFRGADYRNILNFEKDFENPSIFRLGQSYRHTQTVLAAAQKLISHNRSHIPIDLWTENTNGEKIDVFQAFNEVDEAREIVNRIKADNLTLEDVAVLYRTNAQSRALEDQLVRFGISYKLIGGVKFYERKEVKDILAYLRIIFNPLDAVSITRVEKLGKRRFAIFKEMVESTENLANHTPLEILDIVIKTTDFLEYVKAKNSDFEDRIENIKELKTVASEFDSLQEFLESVALVENDSGKSLPNTNAITLMTLHAAKGLEFQNIFMIGMEEGLFPHNRSLTDSNALEEERRLCYVGMTRAKKKLTLLYAKKRQYFGSTQVNEPSRFIDELPIELLEYIGEKKEVTKTSSNGIDDFLDNLEINRNYF